MKEQGLMSDTKGSINDFVDNYFIVSSPKTKSNESPEDLIYAVNFVNDGGYALLSADSRIGEDILAFVEEGSVHENDFYLSELNLTPTDNDDLTKDTYDEMVDSGVLAMAEMNSGHLKTSGYKYL